MDLSKAAGMLDILGLSNNAEDVFSTIFMLNRQKSYLMDHNQGRWHILFNTNKNEPVKVEMVYKTRVEQSVNCSQKRFLRNFLFSDRFWCNLFIKLWIHEQIS